MGFIGGISQTSPSSPKGNGLSNILYIHLVSATMSKVQSTQVVKFALLDVILTVLR